MKCFNVAIIGATGSVGGEILSILSNRSFPISRIFLIASQDSIGKKLEFGDKIIAISSIDEIDFSNIDIMFSAVKSEVAKEYIPLVANQGVVVIDKSSCFRLNKDVPLIVPEINSHVLAEYTKRNIIASPNCCVIPIVTVLKPLDNFTSIKRVVISTYQSVSGVGKLGMDELYNQTKAKYVFNEFEPKIFADQIAFNLIPCIGKVDNSGFSTEEIKISSELQKILGSHVQTTVTCVRVPVFVGHSIAINVQFSNYISLLDIEEILNDSDSVVVNSHLQNKKYITPVESVGTDVVYVSRIRKDSSIDNAFNLWLTCDNLRKGAGLNAVQIAEELIKIL